VQVGADHVAATHALAAVAAVVAVAREHATQRPLGRAEIGTSAVVLEARDDARAVPKVGLDGAVADQPRSGLAHGVQVHQPNPREPLVAELVRAPEQLIAAADGEHHRTMAGGGVQGIPLGGRHVVGDGDLVAILAAADVEEVMGVGLEALADGARGEREAEPAPLAACAQHGDVAAIGVDVHELRIERADAEGGGHAGAARITIVLPT
jgi:hypothetical protein